MAKQGEKKVRAARELAIAPPEETANLRFREGGMASPYRDLLEDLQEARAGSALKIMRAARATACKWIRDLGLRVTWGKDPKHPEFLYIKIVGEVPPPLTMQRAISKAAEERRAAPTVPAAAPVAGKETTEEKLLLRTLQTGGPATLKQLARVLGVTPTACAERLSPMVDKGRLEIEDNCYRIKTA
jgi:hypothetical protein